MNALSNYSDAALVRRLKGGDSGAFEELYERYKTKVLNTTYRITGNAAEAADVAQEIFINIFKKIDLFQFRSSFSTWVYRMSVNASIDRYRKLTRHPTYSTDNPEFQETKTFRKLSDDSAPGGDQEASQRELDADIQRTITQLPIKLRTVIVLRYLQDLSYEEVAKVLNCSQGTVKSRLNRAHGKLRGLIEKMEKEGSQHG